MTIREKIRRCQYFFEELAKILNDDYEVVGSCIKDISMYLIPKGTETDISYYGKPDKSFRISDHWNWYANLNKCEKKHYIQCWSVDVPYPRDRKTETGPSEPRRAIQVAVIGKGGKYHAVYGEKWNKKHKRWDWLENTPEQIVSVL